MNAETECEMVFFFFLQNRKRAITLLKRESVLTCSPKFWSRGGTQQSSLCAHGETRFQLHTHLAWLALASPPQIHISDYIEAHSFCLFLSSCSNTTLKVSTQVGNYL